MVQSLHLWARRLARAALPAAARIQLRRARRSLSDRRSGTRFARRRAAAASFPHVWARSSARLQIYEGQGASAEGKRRNIALFASALDALVIAPGETLSLWDAVGRPTAAGGYRPAAALRNGQLVTEIGGAVCLASTVVYRAALDAGLVPVERRPHSVDSYGDQRYFELGLDATVEYAYIDLRLRNDSTTELRLAVVAIRDAIEVSFAAATPCPHRVELRVRALPAPPGRRRVVAERLTLTEHGEVLREDLGESVYLVPDDAAAKPRLVASGRSGRSSLPS